MSAGAEHHRASLLEWLQTAAQEGWIDEAEIRSLAALETTGADALFEAQGGRPLTVGFFGGTGVGKSSLLNRLIGDAVAEVGVERPTSTRVTVYVHEHYPLNSIEERLPLERVRVQEHLRDEYRHVAWIDMPDMDSVERANRELVFEWLPYIDWLIYVVSPERYRDDAGWRVLKRRGHRHHWLFVMNRWDTGTDDQYADFAQILGGEGFDDSLLLRTSCVEPDDDDFGRMIAMIDRALADHGLQQLQQVGERARLADLHHQCERFTELLGGDARWREFIDHGEAAMREQLTSLIRYLEDETAIEAADAARRAAGAVEATVDAPVPRRLVAEHLQDIESAIAVARSGLPAEPVNQRTRPILASLDGRVADAVTHGFREGAARPGNAVQRGAAALMKKLVFGLPLVVCLAIGYVVLTRYQQGLGGTGGFLGFDFLAHSLMVLVLAALAPYLMARLLRPSVKKSIIRRVGTALERTRTDVIDEWRAAMNEVIQRRRELNRLLETIRAAIEKEL